MELKKMQLKDLTPYEKNARKNDKAVKAVIESIKQCEYIAPIICDENLVVLAGHTRLKALQKMGRKTAEVIIKSGLTDEQKKKYRLLDNKTAEIADWDFELLAQELDGLDFGELTLDWGLDEPEPEVKDDEYDPEPPAEPKTKPGDIYELGTHRLICGDSTDPETVRRLMAGEQADMVLTDPPYNVDYSSKNKALNKADKGDCVQTAIINDNMTSAVFNAFLTAAFTNLCDALRPGGAFYVWYAQSERINFETALNNAGLAVRQNLIWVKNCHKIGRQDYQWKHEPCLYGWRDGAAHYFIDDRNISTVFEDERPDIAKMKKDEMRELLEQIYSDKVSTTVIHEKKPARSDLHPTMKPVVLMGRLIKNSSKVSEIVLDLFGGSGSTLIAAEQLARRCYMVEYEPKYCDVIIDRWQKLTGETARKIEEQ